MSLSESTVAGTFGLLPEQAEDPATAQDERTDNSDHETPATEDSNAED